jgi:hypothetical protein
MKLLIPVFLGALITGARSGPAAEQRVPVVLELFTSEGCSSCPPADEVLSRLAARQPVAGVQVIPLEMHVTYWDRLGWKDPASLEQATRRQQDYSRVFGADRVYTPQAVIDGREELIGSADAGVREALVKAARLPHGALALTAALDGDAVLARVSVTAVPGEAKEPLNLLVAITEDGLTSAVRRGENGGRTLRHDGVVRALPAPKRWTPPPSSGGGSDSSVVIRVGLKAEWRRDHLHVVALLQGERSRRVWAAATVPLE